MDLSRTVEALQEVRSDLNPNGIIISIDLGVHSFCQIDSNCPKAIEVRGIMTEAGIDLVEVLDSYQTLRVPVPVDMTLPSFNGEVFISVAGQEVRLDFNTLLEGELRNAIHRKLNELEDLRYDIERLGNGMFRSYLTEIRRARNSQVLPQLHFSEREMIEAGCMITTRDGNYAFLFPQTYKPEYIVSGGIRYELYSGDKELLVRKVCLRFVISHDNVFVSVSLVDMEGVKFGHYHGTDTDCWGNVQLPTSWDMTMHSLTTLSYDLMMSLATINLNSLMQGEPFSMPNVHLMMERSTELGREGELRRPLEHPGIELEEPEEPERPGWGRGWGRRD